MGNDFISFSVETSGFDDVLARLDAMQKVLGEHDASELSLPNLCKIIISNKVHSLTSLISTTSNMILKLFQMTKWITPSMTNRT